MRREHCYSITCGMGGLRRSFAGRARPGQRRVSRGLAVADINNDGALAVLISNLDGSPTLLRNVSKPRGHGST